MIMFFHAFQLLLRSWTDPQNFIKLSVGICKLACAVCGVVATVQWEILSSFINFMLFKLQAIFDLPKQVRTDLEGFPLWML